MPTNKPAKTMSSGLLTMKFMQRAAASNNLAAQSNKGKPAARRHEESEESDPSPKRRRISSQRDPHTSELEAISAAIKAEEDKRAAAIARQAAEAGETEWVLEFPTGTIPSVSRETRPGSNRKFEESDDEEEEFEGRRDYGGFKSKKRTYLPDKDSEPQKPNSGVRNVPDHEVRQLTSISGSRGPSSNKPKGKEGRRSER